VRKGTLVPDYITAALLALGLVLPLAVACIAALWERESLSGTPLRGKVLMVLALLASIGFFGGIATYGDHLYNDWGLYAIYPYYWLIGIVIVIVSISWLGESYGKKNDQ
jgi:hypothetical protein